MYLSSWFGQQNYEYSYPCSLSLYVCFVFVRMSQPEKGAEEADGAGVGAGGRADNTDAAIAEDNVARGSTNITVRKTKHKSKRRSEGKSNGKRKHRKLMRRKRSVFRVKPSNQPQSGPALFFPPGFVRWLNKQHDNMIEVCFFVLFPSSFLFSISV